MTSPVDERVGDVRGYERSLTSILAVALLASPGAGALQAAHGAGADRPAPPPPAAVCAEPAAADAGRGADLRAFLGLLDAWRRGDTAAAGPLSALALHLCEAHARCDARAVAQHYLRLDARECAAGLAHEEEFHALRREVVAAGEEGMEPELWSRRGRELVAELVALAEAVQHEADFAPAARALALAARLQLDLFESEARSRWTDPDATTPRLSEAALHAEQSIALFERAGQVTPRLEPLWVLARIERAAGRFARARSSFLDVLELARAVQHADWVVHALFGLLALARDSGDVHAAEALLVEASRWTTPAECWPLAREHAALLLQADRPGPALDVLRRYPPSELAYLDEWYGLTAGAHLRSGDYQGARQAIDSMDAPSSDELAVLTRATIELAEGRPQGVVDELGDQRTLQDWSLQGQAQACSLLGAACLVGDRVELAQEWLRAALARASLWAAMRAGEAEGGGGSVFGEWMGLHTVALLAEACARGGDALEAARVIEEYQSRGLRDDTPTRGELLVWAARFERGLITWCVGADSGIAVHVAANGRASSHRLAHGRVALEEAVRRLREAAIAGPDGASRALGEELATLLLPPGLRAALRERDPEQRLLFLAHGPLERLPVALLRIEGELLDDLCSPLVLSGLPGPADAGEESERGHEPTWHLLGAPTGQDADGSPRELLPGARTELETIAGLRPGSTLSLGADFDAPRLEQALRSGAPLHIATHLYPAPGCGEGLLDPLALLLAEGELYCAERLRRLAPRSPLVVLSTCESAGGRLVDAEGLHGLARAFLAASPQGSRNLLVTLWPVEDRAAARAAVVFHEALLAGRTPSRAARELRARLRAEGFASGEWAAYGLLGRD